MNSSRENPYATGEAGSFRVLNLPQDNPELKRSLEEKLKEYEARLAEVTNPKDHEAIVGNQTGGDSMYKAVILRELLNKGEVNTDAIKSRISDSGVINEAVFNNAVGVIEDYVKTGGKNLEGGTGLAGR